MNQQPKPTPGGRENGQSGEPFDEVPVGGPVNDQAPRDPLAGRSGYTDELMAELTDAEVDECVAYWQFQRQHETDAYSRWWCGNALAGARREQERRRAAQEG